MSKSITLQAFQSAVEQALDFGSMELIEPLSAVVPSEVADRKSKVKAATTWDEYRALKTFQSYVIPAGTKVQFGTGREGNQLQGGSAFLVVAESDAIESVNGTSAEIRRAFVEYVASEDPLA